MRTVLIIAPQFSPSSYPPAQRVRLFAAHLEAFGWKPVVLSVTEDSLEETPDRDFEKLVPSSLEVLRVRALPARSTRPLGIGDLGIRSYFALRSKAAAICRTRKIDAVLIPGPPWHPFRIGPYLKNKFKTPYVLDMIDPWVSSMGKGESILKKSFWFRQMALVLEPAAVRGAGAVIAVSDGINDLLKERYPDTRSKPYSAIPYGAEPEDFKKIGAMNAANPVFDRRDGLFHWAYVGTMLPRGVETLRAIFRAVKSLKEPRLRIHFVGTTYAAGVSEGPVMPLAREEGVEALITEHACRVPYVQAVKVLLDADAVLSFGTTETFYASSKIYPAMHAGRPHLGVYHRDSSAARIVQETRTGETVLYTDTEPALEAVGRIREAMARIMNPSYIRMEPDAAAVQRYSAREMTRALAAVLDSAAGGTRA